jgi:hypothetical protein
MKKAKAPRVPVLENTFEVNLPKLIQAAKATGSSRLILDDGDVRTVAVLAETRLAVLLGGKQWVVKIVLVQCLQGRVRPLLKCPRAHEGNFQSLYYRAGEFACRKCHALRYRTTLAATGVERVRLKRDKLLASMGPNPSQLLPERQPYRWRRRYRRLAVQLAQLTSLHYRTLRIFLDRQGD